MSGTAIADVGRALGVVAARDLHRQARHPGVLVAQGVQVLFFLLVYAIGFDGMIGSVDGLPFSAYVYPGIVAIQVVTLGVSSGLTYAFDREYGMLREMLVAPVPRLCLPLGKVVATAVLAGGQAAVMLAFAPLLGLPLSLVGYLGGVLAFAVVCVVFGLAGVLLATLVPQVQTLQSVVQMAMYPLLFLSGSVFRPDAGPGWLSAVMRINPMTYATDAIRHLLIPGHGAFPLWLDLVVLAGLTAVLATVLRWKVGR
ncbi:ABC transporter permease [Actinokineospora diospyrosa]|uniref:Transport permease protein n=1 Tax=Actinokineospora diospyrosa TaxID=103728 RepID=A0A8G1EH46_9PSEU|nr:ABC transporter permease [Actinokineospora diospyrosa]MCP2271568.1 ABC-2 type transport system permease protein [Actinokineospora diospyrosa]QYZ85383.1 DisU [Actinokineospora diospyrosa]